MESKDVKVGMVVYSDNDRYNEMFVAQLPDEDGNVICSWSHGESDTFNISDLKAVDPELDKAVAVRVSKELNDAADAFDAAFKALKSAESIAYETGLDMWEMKYRNLVDMTRLEEAVEGNGWSMSSIRC